MKKTRPRTRSSRRRALKLLTAGAGSAVFGRALLSLADEKGAVTLEGIRQAEWISGLTFTDEDRKLMLDGMNEALADYAKLRAVPLDNGVPPSLWFDPTPEVGTVRPGGGGDLPQRPTSATVHRPGSDDDLAFAPVAELHSLLLARKVSSVELTRLYLDRLKRYDPILHCVVTLTEDLALRQAEQADLDIAAGNPRRMGPLHGIPWGAKDLLAVPGYRTTWGATPYQDQIRAEQATVVSKLERTGAVLVSKLSVGALAWGDVWFGGMTRNPWKPEQGSSGSSAGPAAATAAGLVGFAIGTETWGSIVSPCTRCGVTGLRPTFGRVSRYGTMALSWSMDKIGPIARTAEDCAHVFMQIRGPDRLDPTTRNERRFDWPLQKHLRKLRVGFVQKLFEEDRAARAGKDEDKEGLREWQGFDLHALTVLRDLGIELIPVSLPDSYPIGALSLILTAEAATAFDELTRTGRDDLLERQVADAWPNVLRQGQLIPAVEYIRANRIRTLVMAEMEKLLTGLDAYVVPSFGGDNLLLTNLTGHPAVVVPNGFRSKEGTPTSFTFIGKPYGEAEILALAIAYQQATDFHLRRPTLHEGGAA